MKICTYILRRGPREGDESNRKTTQVEEDRESQHFSSNLGTNLSFDFEKKPTDRDGGLVGCSIAGVAVRLASEGLASRVNEDIHGGPSLSFPISHLLFCWISNSKMS